MKFNRLIFDANDRNSEFWVLESENEKEADTIKAFMNWREENKRYNKYINLRAVDSQHKYKDKLTGFESTGANLVLKCV